jgi:hypothetical protein
MGMLFSADRHLETYMGMLFSADRHLETYRRC